MSETWIVPCPLFVTCYICSRCCYRVKIHLQCIRKLPSFPNCKELQTIIHNHSSSRHVETIESSVHSNSVTINKALYASAGEY